MLNNKSGQIAETKNWKFLSTTICPSSRKGQIAETVTWVVATVIIVVTLIVFIFISVSMSNAKNLTPSKVVGKIGNFLDSDEVGEINRLEHKTIFAISSNDNNKEKILEWINEK